MQLLAFLCLLSLCVAITVDGQFSLDSPSADRLLVVEKDSVIAEFKKTGEVLVPGNLTVKGGVSFLRAPVVFRASKSALQLLDATGGFEAVVSWDYPAFDSHAMFNRTSGVYRIPMDGYYQVSVVIGFAHYRRLLAGGLWELT
jgi:hypothetical protein